jgi:hypothetical protein
MAAREVWNRCYSVMTGGGPGETMDSPRRVLARLRRACPTCPYFPYCCARALLREADDGPRPRRRSRDTS